MQLFQNHSSDATRNAELNLIGRTHYVDPDTRRYFRSRILSARPVCGGLLFAILESVSLDPHHSKRGFRPVFFDLFGTVVERVKMEETFSTRRQAEKEYDAALARLDGDKITREGIERAERQHAREMQEMRETLARVNAKNHNTD